MSIVSELPSGQMPIFRGETTGKGPLKHVRARAGGSSTLHSQGSPAGAVSIHGDVIDSVWMCRWEKIGRPASLLG